MRGRDEHRRGGHHSGMRLPPSSTDHGRVALPHSISNRTPPSVIIRGLLLPLPPSYHPGLSVHGVLSSAYRLRAVLHDGESLDVLGFTSQGLHGAALAACKTRCLTAVL